MRQHNFVVELNQALNTPRKEDPELKIALNEYIRCRNECLDFNKVAACLHLDKADYKDEGQLLMNNFRVPSNNNPVGKDLEARAKSKTLQNLKKQGQQYKSFNENVLYLIDPWTTKKRLIENLKANKIDPDTKA